MQPLTRTTILSLVSAFTSALSRRHAATWGELGRPQPVESVAADADADAADTAWLALHKRYCAGEFSLWNDPSRTAAIAARAVAEAAGPRATAESEYQAAAAALADACDSAPWGSQPGEHGRVFVRNYGGWPQDQDSRVQVCLDGLPVVTVTLDWDMAAQAAALDAGVLDAGEVGRRARTITVVLHDRAAGRAAREAQRAAGRVACEAYEALLDEAARHIIAGRLPARWEIVDGQRGGYIGTAPVWETQAYGHRYCADMGPRVSCAGALRRAGISAGDAAAATLRALVTTTPQSGRGQLDTRSRRLPVRDRRHAEVAL